MKVVFRTDASRQIGTGHVVRSLTVADELRSRGAECYFICRAHQGNMIAAIRQRGYDVTELPVSPVYRQLAPEAGASQPAYADWLGSDRQQDAEQTLKFLQAIKPDLLLIDHYAIDIRWEAVLRPHVRRMMVIDDLADRRHECDFLLDQNWFGDGMSRRYRGLVPDHCVTMLGPRYALLKPEYAMLRTFMLPRDGEVGRVLVFMGGSDPTNETAKVVQALTHPSLMHLLVDVVIGTNHPDTLGISRMVEARRGIQLYSGLPSLAGLMMRADLMIGGGGSTTWERMCLGLPAVVICIADNQAAMTRALSRSGYLELLGNKDDVSVKQISEAVCTLIGEREILSSISRKASDLVNGDGVGLVCDVLVQIADDRSQACAIDASFIAVDLIKIRRASTDDVEMLFEWRNDIRIRRHSRNAKPLSGLEHANWFSRNLSNESSELLIGLYEGSPVGCVRFDIEDERAEVSIYLNPTSHGRGWGSGVLTQAMEWMYAEHPHVLVFEAEVLVDNVASTKLFQRCGYHLARQKFEFKRARQ